MRDCLKFIVNYLKGGSLGESKRAQWVRASWKKGFILVACHQFKVNALIHLRISDAYLLQSPQVGIRWSFFFWVTQTSVSSHLKRNSQWRNHWGSRGTGAPLDSEKFAKIGEKREKIRKKREKSGKIREKEEKSGRFFHFAPPDR